MKKLLTKVSIFFAVVLAAPVLLAAGASAQADPADPATPGQTSADSVCDGVALTGVDCEDDTVGGSVEGIVTVIINILSLIVGVISVIMIVVAGLQYVLSGGDSTKVTNAKNTILYAIVGLIVVALAQAIVVFVLNNVDSSTTTTTP